jgi:hypothetical protein
LLFKASSSKKNAKSYLNGKSWVYCQAYIIPAIVGNVIRLILQKARAYLKGNQKKRDGSMAQVVMQLPSKHKALSSNTTLPPKREWTLMR